MKSILLIEDDNTLRENIKELLELKGYRVYDAPNGEKGVENTLRYLPDLIICDILMPVMDGYEVYEILNNNKKTRQIPFIFLSAKSNPEDVRKGMNLGADDYLTKPFKEEDLISSIESRLAKYAILTENQKRQRGSGDSPGPEVSSLQELRNYFREQGQVLELNKNSAVYRERKNADFIYLIEEGLVKTHRMDEYGKELITGIYREDDFFGFYYFKDVSTYPETATALEDCLFYRIYNSNLSEILSSSHDLTIELAQLLSDNLSILKNHLLEMAYASVLKKTTNTILNFAEIMKAHHADDIKISRSDLASIAGISTESFIRSLSSLKKEGLIDIEGRNIKILDLSKLQKVRW
ncbi:response regulator [Salegentibacter chungangensis]|uniref:Response regulator n=1 Tax=Salegentibacter chungangensis TaxID=1335724 RepID=A0ABW3NQY3_9FLAO